MVNWKHNLIVRQKSFSAGLIRHLLIKRKEFPDVSVVIMDTTYFGRGFGVMVFKNNLDGVVLYKQYQPDNFTKAKSRAFIYEWLFVIF